MKPKEFILQTVKGEPVFAFEWKPEGKIKAVVVNTHGLGEYSLRYQHVADFYNQNHIAMIGFDLFGHGKSGGKRGELPEKDTHLESIDLLIEQAREKYPGSPIILRGHSLGGELVLWHALEKRPEIKGIISTSPFFAANEPLPPIKLFLAKMMSNLLPAFSMENGLDPKALSRDQAVVEKYVIDPLVHKMVSARLGWAMVEQAEWIMNHASEFPLPLLIVVGSAERIVNRAKIEEFAKLVPNADLKIWDGLFHETHNEPEKDMVLKYELEWVKKVLK